ncbi:MAG: hypothetical protein KKC51_08175 [Verrucomicrobia bacterium]|nr:hypothetical protein [Verrucomicrobiota bacterium]
MADTDFFDDDLIKQRESAKRIKLGPADEPAVPLGEPASDEVPVRPITDFNLTRMARFKQDMGERSAQASQDIERLHQRQEEIEREKHDTDDLRRKTEEYERGKRDMVERFGQCLVTLEKEELRAEKLSELLASIRKRFKMMMGELQELNEEGWPEDSYRDELTRALSILENARQEYNKSMSRLDAIQGEKGPVAEHAPVTFEDRHAFQEIEHSFGYWIKVGLAVSLPLIVFLAILTAVLIVLQSSLLI